jgi:hypothetical protein
VVTYVQIRVTVICVAVSWVNTARKNKVGILPSWGARLELSYRRLLWMTSTRVVQEMLGHAKIRQTMDTYSPCAAQHAAASSRSHGLDAGLKRSRRVVPVGNARKRPEGPNIGSSASQ